MSELPEVYAMRMTLNGKELTVISEETRLKLGLNESDLTELGKFWLSHRLTVRDLYEATGVKTYDTDIPLGHPEYGKGTGAIVYDDPRFFAGGIFGKFVHHYTVKNLLVELVEKKVASSDYEVWDLERYAKEEF